jgi:uncharacterized protein YegP (UPF0339 family)
MAKYEAKIFKDGIGEYPWRVKLYEGSEMIDVEVFRTHENAEHFINLWGYTYEETKK